MNTSQYKTLFSIPRGYNFVPHVLLSHTRKTLNASYLPKKFLISSLLIKKITLDGFLSLVDTMPLSEIARL